MFRTNRAGLPPGHLLLAISREGVYRDGPNEGPTKLFYNIELAPVTFGIPNAAFPVVLFILAGILAILVALPKIEKVWLPSLAKWMSGSL
eukprot:jgi/Ulvmu1/7014/UM033_0073.1